MGFTRCRLVVLLGAGLFAMQSPTSSYGEMSACRAVTYEDSPYTVCEADLRHQVVRLFWKRADGEPYGYLASLPQSLGEHRGRLLFATNAGMYRPDYWPAGLYVENGRELVRANTKAGPGNFHMKPNGVFYVSGQVAGVLETGDFLKQRPHAEFATQSGPMLVIDNRVHPRFMRSGGSRKHRNGVGILDANRVLFAISRVEVPFGEFARLFRDKLRCNNALFLDGGSVPALYSPEASPAGNLLPLGPMIAVYDR